MAITNAQQYQQLVKKDANGKRPGYRGIGGYQSGRSAPSSSSSKSSGSTAGPGDTGGEGGNRPSDQSDTQSRAVDRSSALQTYNTKKATGRLGRQDPMGGELQYRNGVLIDETGRPVDDTFRGGFTGDLTENEKTLEKFIDSKANYPTYTPSYVKFLGDLNRQPNRKYFVENVLRAGKIPGVDYASLDDEDFDIEQAYKDYMSDRLAGNIDAMGNPLGGSYYDSSGQLVVTDTRDDGAGQKILPEDTIGDTEEDEVNPRDYTGLAPRFMGSSFDFTGLAEGGIARTGAMDGGRMRQMEMMQDEDDPTGGIMDLESGRQMYFLGKLVKKAGRAIKKVVKSPIGKAALLYFGGKALMGAGGGKGLGSFFGKGKSLSSLFSGGKSKNLLSGIFDYAKDNPYKSIFGLSTLAGLSGKDKDEDGPIDYGLDINIDAIRANPYKFLPAGIIGSNYQRGTEGRKDGGRMGYQEGGDAEPVAKKTMPLLDMDGMEKDYREEGGFVPIGRMERADDVPARLSKNEFVFTADAVRNAGDGDIDKGAEVMYNMMKNLESGGEVSEESQGLDGAREMFQTSKRLEEVL